MPGGISKQGVRQTSNRVAKQQRRTGRSKDIGKRRLKDTIRELETFAKASGKGQEGQSRPKDHPGLAERNKLDTNKFGNERKGKPPAELGRRSIFYDPDWNADGQAPEGFRNIPYNPTTFKRRGPLITRLAGLDNIVIPDFCLDQEKSLNNEETYIHTS